MSKPDESIAESLSSNELSKATVDIKVGDQVFPTLDYGDGPVVVLLHGFPDSRHLWRYQIPALAAAGFRTVAPDLRGFGEAPKPDEVEAYALPTVLEDVVGVLDAMDAQEVSLVGHDWGAAVAWLLSAFYPDRVERLVALSVGAPNNSQFYTVEQRESSWYMYFFQFEEVAEEWLRHDDWALFEEWSRGEGDYERQLRDLARPGALTAALNWYRANARPLPPGESGAEYPNLTCSVLGVWSDEDHYLTEAAMRGSAEKVDGSWRYETIADASHWMMLDKPAEINHLLVEFLAE